jgi:2-phospho-L-lactate guanylyltransferase
VISADATVLAVARARGVDALFDHAEDLNGALTQAAGHYSAAGATGLLVMHGDLPLAAADELALLARTLDQGSDLVLAGARDGGTNALACLAPHPLPFLFGGRSLERHLMAARERGLRTQVVRSGGLERDIDRPEDLIWLFEAPGATAAQQLVRRMGIIERLACV